ncbi:MAG: hypothetical protein ACNA7Y_05745 [Gammaproteobacteria bacterium]
MSIRNFILGLLGLLATPIATADDNQVLGESTDLSAKSLSQIVSGNATLLERSDPLTIASSKTVGNTVEVTLKAAEESTTVTIKLAANTFKKSGIIAGEILKVIPKGAGSLLMASGKAIAFIPNELGKTLIFSFPRD